MDHDGDGGETTTTSSLRTRSKAAPDWTVEESLILANEVSAVESDCRDTLSSFQKWKIIVENCNALDVNRNLNQCRRKWDSLLSDYRKIKQSGSKKASFNAELFKVIERYVRDYEGGCDTETDSDPEAAPEIEQEPEAVLASIVQYGSKKQKSAKVIPQKRSSVEERAKPNRRVKSEEIKVEECNERRVDQPTINTESKSPRPEETNQEEQEQMIAEKVRENAELIEAIVKGHPAEDLVIGESTNNLTRLSADKLIMCLGNLAASLNQLCEFVQ